MTYTVRSAPWRPPWTRRLDHEAGFILAGLRHLMVRVAQENIDKGLDEMRAFAPLIDIMGAMHERARVRLFIS